jgi:hypothetical protein
MATKTHSSLPRFDIKELKTMGEEESSTMILFLTA